MVIVMKKVFMAMFLLLALALLLAGCAEKQETETGTVQLTPLLLEQPAEYYQGDTVQEINAAMFVYDCYYLGENDWLAYASVGLAQGSDRLLFRLKDGAACLVYQQMTPKDEWLFYSSYLPQYGKCALYTQIKQQFVFYDVQSGDVEQVKMPEELSLSAKDRVIWLGGEQYLLGRSMANERLRLSLYDKAGAEEQFLAELNGGWLRDCGQTSTGLWPLLSDAGDLCVLKLTGADAETEVHHCAQEWPAAAEFISYNDVLAVPGAESERVLLTIYCDDETVYQVIDLAANKEIGRHVVSNHIGEARYANDIKLLGCYGDKMFFPIYYHYNYQKPDKHYGQVWSYDYISGDWELVYNSRTAKNRYYFYFGGTVSPDGNELMLRGRCYTMRLPLAKIMEETELTN